MRIGGVGFYHYDRKILGDILINDLKDCKEVKNVIPFTRFLEMYEKDVNISKNLKPALEFIKSLKEDPRSDEIKKLEEQVEELINIIKKITKIDLEEK